MVNAAVTNGETALVLSYAPADARRGLAALLALDGTLGGLLRAGREPIVAQMRLTWWHEALAALDRAPPPAQPVLEALAAAVLPAGVSGAELAELVDGWEALIDDEPLSDPRMDDYARGRGETLFRLAGRVLGAGAADPLAEGGRGWALADLAGKVSDPGERARAREVAGQALAAATGRRWSRGGRALGALAHSARLDLAADAKPAGAPSRVARLAWHRLTGR